MYVLLNDQDVCLYIAYAVIIPLNGVLLRVGMCRDEAITNNRVVSASIVECSSLWTSLYYKI